MKTFLFYEKNASGSMALSAENFEEATTLLSETVKHPKGWRCDDEDGEDE